MKPLIFAASALFATLSLSATMGAQDQAPKSDLHAIIEVGSSSLKPVVVQEIDVPRNPKDETKIPEPFTVLEQMQTVEVNPVLDGTEEKVADAVDQVAKAIMEKHKVPKSNIYIVGSSGLADRFGERLVQRKAAIEERINAKLEIKMEWILPEDEARYEFRGVLANVPDSTRGDRFTKVLLLDIGSGNIKGAFVLSTNPLKFDGFSFGLGTKSFEEEVRKKMKEGDNFLAKAEEYRKDVLFKKIADAAAAHPGLQNLTRVYLAGGAPYGMAVLMDPAEYSTKKHFVQIPQGMIAKFYTAATTDLQALLNPSLENVKSDVKADIEKQVKTISTKIFSGNQVISAAQLLLSLDKGLGFSEEQKDTKKPKKKKKGEDAETEGKVLFFAKDALYAWPRGYLATKIEAARK